VAVVNFNYISSSKFVLSQKILLMSIAWLSKFQSFWRFPTKQHNGIILWDTLYNRLPTHAVYTLPKLNLWYRI